MHFSANYFLRAITQNSHKLKLKIGKKFENYNCEKSEVPPCFGHIELNCKKISYAQLGSIN